MALLDTLIVILILFLPFFIIVILPMILSYYYGSKALENAKRMINQKLTGILARRLGAKTIRRKQLDKLNMEYSYEVNGIKYEVDVSFIERRTYAYYFAKLFGGIPDSLFVKATLIEPPPAILYMVSRRKKKLIDKSQKYILVLEEVKLGRLNDKFLILSDSPRAAIRYFDQNISESIRRLYKNLTYIIADYKEPHIELGFEISDKEIESEDILREILELSKMISEKIKSVKGRGKQSDLMVYVRKILRESG